jgi:hypothetical protein
MKESDPEGASMGDLVRVPSVRDMTDEIMIKHMQHRHDEDIGHINIGYEEPDRKAKGLPRRLRAGVEWRTFHDKMHELYDGRTDGAAGMYDHVHKEQSYE